jgi:hypothetical protein
MRVCTNDRTHRPRLFTAVCSVGEQRLIIQLLAADPVEAVEKWLATVSSKDGPCILSAEQLNEFTQDFTDGIIEPVACAGVASVWACSNVVNDQLIDLLLMAMEVCDPEGSNQA